MIFPLRVGRVPTWW